MRILFCGDIVGRSGRQAVSKHLSSLKQKHKIDVVIANGENAAHGFGLTPKITDEIFSFGVHVITSGNHMWDKSEIIPYMDKVPNLIRPINYPKAVPGKGFVEYKLPDGRKILVINAMCRLFMDALDDPFERTMTLLEKYRLGSSINAIFVDLHGEASSEKMAFGYYLDGRVSAVIGTHTHVPTADHRILPKGTAYQTDAGMCGDYDSVVGMGKAEAIMRFTKKMRLGALQPCEGEGTLSGVIIDTNDQTGLATSITPIRLGGILSQTSMK
ncbi:MAG: TIGR00282 family metallophosphoesterase [Alphaproteobacteria bacterium]|nr:TIGR00282 family metallophosphoesterase [Alphaproteobacteria bacterium]